LKVGDKSPLMMPAWHFNGGISEKSKSRKTFRTTPTRRRSLFEPIPLQFFLHRFSIDSFSLPTIAAVKGMTVDDDIS
jgi:hypothetical protein